MTDRNTTRASMTALLHGLVDYAGLFPPAQLDMATTVAKFAGFRAHPDHWMLNRLIVPVARLDEFETAADSRLPRTGDDVWQISALTVPAEDPAFTANIERIDTFNHRHADPAHGAAIIDTIELKAANADDIDEVLDELPDELYPFFEINWRDDPRGMIASLVGSDAGAKLRTGGVTPDLYPTVPAVAQFILACARAGVPMKATAGLHHPLRHFSDAVQCDEHGFLNVFLAATVAYRHGVDAAHLERILDLRDIADFTVHDDSITLADLTVTSADIDKARSLIAISYGSCSFEEPCADLRALQLL